MDRLPQGYAGKILEIDLNTLTFLKPDLSPRLARLFAGGRGLGAALLIHLLVKPSPPSNPFFNLSPLSRDNILIFSSSPLTGTPVPAASRFHAVFKSPLTGAVGSANAGGKWGVALKRTGHDALVLKGRSPRPVVIYINEHQVRFDSPPAVAELDVENITASLEKRYGKQVKVLTAGLAGHNLSLISSIMNDRGRALGRGGTGAVLASKNCWAVVVEGSIKPAAAHPERLRPGCHSGSVLKGLAKIRLGKLTKPPRQYGTLASMGTDGLLGMLAQHHELIHKNFSDNDHLPENLDKIKGEALASHPRIEVKRRSCYNCPIGCTRETRIRGAAPPAAGEGPEFETVAMLGANLDIYDLELITRANYLCNRWGLDTISLGGTLAALMEIFECVIQKNKKNLTAPEKTFLIDIDEFRRAHGDPVFGNSSCLLPLIQAAAEKKGIGKFIAEGAFRLCRRYGHPEISMTVKKMELPAYDPRAVWTQALSYMVNSRGGCHLQAGYSAPLAFCAGYGEFPGNKSEGAALVARHAAYHNCAYDFLGVCAFAGFSITLDEWSNMWNDVTGLEYKASDLETIAKRVFSLERLFNLLCGFSCRDDWLPDRFFSRPIQVEGRKQICPGNEFKRMRSEFYQAMGWDEYGIPSLKTYSELELEAVLPLEQTQKWLKEKLKREMT
ncbi:MAG: aldehyde ferredoxin oxidoreductase family protein [Candidatus Aminicenantes bacterium]